MATQTQNFVKAVIDSGVDNPKINEMVMNMLLTEMTSNPEQQMREAMFNRIIESDQPDFAMAKNILDPNSNLDELLGSATPTGADAAIAEQRDLEVANLLKKGKLNEAKTLEQLSPQQYSALQNRDKAESISGGQRGYSYGAGVPLQALGRIGGSQLTDLFSKIPGITGDRTKQGELERQQFINQLLQQ